MSFEGRNQSGAGPKLPATAVSKISFSTNRAAPANPVNWKQMPSESILGMDLADLGGLLGPAQPGYRAKQIYQAIYQGGATDLAEITTLPAALRQDLAARHAVGLPEIAHVYRSAD